MKLAIIGAGYVGLVSAVCLAAKDHDVTCVDINPAIVAQLNVGEPTIYEKGLPALLKNVCASGRFRATTDLSAALDDVELVMVAVGTPSENGEIDLQHIKAAAQQIGKYLKKVNRHISVVIKSTVVPGTTDTLVRKEIETASGKSLGDFGLGMNPEFLREGEAIEDFFEPDRIVFGYEDEKTLQRLEDLYAAWNVDKLYVNTRTAEMIKYANNALLATQISTVNEIANLAAAMGGIDIFNVMQGVHLDKRWNPTVGNSRIEPEILTYLIPGCGFGGSCFSKDVQALRSQGEAAGVPMLIMNAVLDVNENQPSQVTQTLVDSLGKLANRQVLLLGLAFKPGTDDVRESASLKIAIDLIKSDAIVAVHDPIAFSNFKRALGTAAKQIKFIDDWQSYIPEVEIIIVATRWPEYASLKHADLSGKFVFDARRMFKPEDVGKAQYLTIGRKI